MLSAESVMRFVGLFVFKDTRTWAQQLAQFKKLRVCNDSFVHVTVVVGDGAVRTYR